MLPFAPSFNLRPIHETDASAYLELLRHIEADSPFALLEAGERQTSVREQREEIAAMLRTPRHMMWVVEDRDRLVAWLGAWGDSHRRLWHSVFLGLGVQAEYQRQGLGRRLLTEAEQWARQQGLRRMELLVASENQAAKRLYQQMGFMVEGTKRGSYRIGDRYLDEHLMSKWLEDTERFS